MKRFIPLLLLSACAVEPLPVSEPAAPVPPPPEAVAECKADSAQRFVGQPLTPSTPEAARLATGSRTVRVIGPNQAVTMDFRTDRLNLKTDPKQVVTEATCG
jgi:hypothetical protein